MLHSRSLALVLFFMLGCDADVIPNGDGSIDGNDGGVSSDAIGADIDELRDGSVTPDDATTPLDAAPSDDAAIPPDDGLPPRVHGFQVSGGERDRVYFESDKPIRNRSGPPLEFVSPVVRLRWDEEAKQVAGTANRRERGARCARAYREP